MCLSPSGKAGVCKTLIVSSILTSHSNEKSSNGRTPPFEGVYLGSSPSFSASPIDGIGIHTCLRSKVLQVRVLYRAFHWTQWKGVYKIVQFYINL